MQFCYLNTPIGKLLLAGEEDSLCHVGFPTGSLSREPDSNWKFSERPFTAAREQLTAYFRGELSSFELTLKPQGTVFQLRVLDELRKIPYGETASYGEIARRIGKPNAARAVGAANGRNPLPIVIPCHRVIGSNGQLTGFGGGMSAKQALLKLEAQKSRALL
jgi:methylated-DNA-[protein]-cysteine S-methyltransferase